MRVVRTYIVQHRAMRGQFSMWQFGFRAKRGCDDSCFSLQTIYDHCVYVLGLPLYYGIVDFSKAFDSVDHDVLLCRLLQMGFDTRVVDML